MVYICPGGNCTGIAIFFFDKVSHLKHPNVHAKPKISRKQQIISKKVFQRFELIHRCGQMSNPESFSKSAKTEWANFESCYYLQ